MRFAIRALAARAAASPPRSSRSSRSTSGRSPTACTGSCAQPLTYPIGVSQDSVTVPVGFVTDFASIPQALQSIIRANGPYILPAVVHDYLYWKQACTREQADRILLLGMIENQVREVHRVAIHDAVRIAGGFAWSDNARDRADGFVRILPADRQQVPVNTSWPQWRAAAQGRRRGRRPGHAGGAGRSARAPTCRSTTR